MLGIAGLAFALGAPLGTESQGCSTSSGINQSPVVDCSQAYTRHVSQIEIQGIVSLLPAILAFSAVLLAILGFSVTDSVSRARGSLPFLWLSALLLAAATTAALLPLFVFTQPPTLPSGMLFLPGAAFGLATAILGTLAAARGSQAAN